MSHLLTQTTQLHAKRASISYRTKVIIPIDIISPPRRKRYRRTTSTKHSKRQNEQHQQTGSVKRTRDQIRIISKDSRMIVAKIVLHKEARCNLVENDACLWLIVRDVSGVLDELREIELGERETADFGDELDQSAELVTYRIDIKGKLTFTTAQWTTTQPAPIARPIGTIEYVVPDL